MQIATVDISNPTNPVVTYDVNPFIAAPDLPPDPSAIYADSLIVPTVSDITTANQYDLAHAALLDAGSLEALVTIEAGPYEALAPVVSTNDSPADTYDLTPATVYYTPPANDPSLVNTANSGPWYFDCGTPTSPVAPGYTQITPLSGYSAATGYGWGNTNLVGSRDRGGTNLLARDFCLPAGTPFYLDLSNGTYNVTILTGDASQKSSMYVHANGLPELTPSAPLGQYLQQTFPIVINNGRLRLEFAGSLCHVNAIMVVRDDSPHKPTIFVASDSTASVYTIYQYPWTGWGDRIAKCFSTNVVVEDLAQPGRSSKSYVEEGWLDTIKNRITTNDYLIEMDAINDAASKDPTRDTSPETTYKAYLRLYVNAARSHGAFPVFVTSQTKRTYDLFGRFFNSVGAYPQAMHELGSDLDVPVIDLNSKSISFLDVIGPAASTNVYMFLAPGEFPNFPNGDADYIHLQDRGATAYAKQVVDGIREQKLPIAKYILPVPQPPVRPTPRSAYQ